MEVCSYSYFWWCGYFWAPCVSFVMTDEFSVRVTKITSRIGVSWTHSLSFCFWPIFNSIMTMLSKGCKPDDFESCNSLKLSFTNIRGFHLNFVECESFLESNSPGILGLCKTNLEDSIDSDNFSVTGYLPLIQKDSVTHRHGFAVYVKEGLPFDSFWNCWFLLMFLTGFTSLSILLSFSIDHLLCLSAQFLILFHLLLLLFLFFKKK